MFIYWCISLWSAFWNICPFVDHYLCFFCFFWSQSVVGVIWLISHEQTWFCLNCGSCSDMHSRDVVQQFEPSNRISDGLNLISIIDDWKYFIAKIRSESLMHDPTTRITAQYSYCASCTTGTAWSLCLASFACYNLSIKKITCGVVAFLYLSVYVCYILPLSHFRCLLWKFVVFKIQKKIFSCIIFYI